MYKFQIIYKIKQNSLPPEIIIHEYESENEAINKYLNILKPEEFFDIQINKIQEIDPLENEIVIKFQNNKKLIENLTDDLYYLEFNLETKQSQLRQIEESDSDYEVDILKLKSEIISLCEKIDKINEQINHTQFIKLVIFCPKCNTQHIDRNEWETKLHKTHLCENCGNEWRPFDFPTIGIENPT